MEKTPFLDEIFAEICEMSNFMYQNPELGNQEFKAVEKLTSFLKAHGFVVTLGTANIPTAFEAVYDTGQPGPNIGYLCEYDALPEIGHGCGHNMMGPMSVGAAAILRHNATCGKIYVYGTPAEETNGAKVAMAEAGIFNHLACAMIVHPSAKTRYSGTSAAMEALQFAYFGQTAHAAGCPEKGINALNAVIQLFNGIDALRQHVTDDVRIHGIISKGGVAANIVPEEAVGQFYVRSATKENLAKVKAQVLNIAEGAALMTGARLEVSNYELSYDDLKTNAPLMERFAENLKALGITDIEPATKGSGSSDIGNVSNVVPTIHPSIGIAHEEIIGHTREFADATITDFAHEQLRKAAMALAMTGEDVLLGKVVF